MKKRFKATVLMYHGVSDTPIPGTIRNYGLVLSMKAFEQQMRFVKNEYDVLPISMITQPEKLSEFKKPLFITFDDGFVNQVTCAASLLKELNLPAVFYLISDFIGSNACLLNHWVLCACSTTQEKSVSLNIGGCDSSYELEDENSRFNSYRKITAEYNSHETRGLLPVPAEFINAFGQSDTEPFENFFYPMSTDQARDLAADPLFTIGSHTCTHAFMKKLDANDTKEELKRSMSDLETSLSCRVEHFSYPGGGYRADSASLVESCGYSTAVNSQNDYFTGKNNFMIPRVNVSIENFDEFKTALHPKKPGLTARLRVPLGKIKRRFT